MIDLMFPVRGETLAGDHAYQLYAALSEIVPVLHQPDGPRFASIGGKQVGQGVVALTEQSRLRVRLRSDQLEQVLCLAGKFLTIGSHAIQLGEASVLTLTPASMLYARVVTYKHSTEPEKFLATTKEKLAHLGAGGEPSIPLVVDGPRQGQPQRRVVRIKDKAVVGYTLLLSGLRADESLRLQEEGLGGRTRMGCGFFVPYRART